MPRISFIKTLFRLLNYIAMMPISAFLPSYLLALLRIPTETKTKPKRSNRLSRNPPFSVLVRPSPPKPPTIHKFTRRLPSYLNNTTVLRNGSAVYTYPHKVGPPWMAHHLFDGVAVAHSLTISTHSKPTVTHTSDYVDHHFLQAISKTPHAIFAPVQIYHPPTVPRILNLVARDLNHDILYNLPVCLEQLPTLGTVARSDVSRFQQIDPRSLSRGKRIEFADLNNQLRGPISASHGTVADDYYYNYVMNLLECNVFSISPTGKTEIIAKVRTQSRLIHAIVATENYVILPLCPYSVNLAKLIMTKSVMSCIQKLPRGATFILVDRRKGGVIAEFCTDPLFMLHFINAYEDGDDVVIDTCAYENTDVVDQLRLENLANDEGIISAVPTRFVLRGVSRAKETYPRMVRTEQHTVNDVGMEFPVVNPNMRGRKYRYAYGTGDCEGRMFLGEVVKLDMETGEVKRWSKKGEYVGEPVFVPRGKGREDEGCLLVVATKGEEDGKEGESALVVIDARSMKEISRAKLGSSMAIGFHASAVHTNST